MSKVEYEHEHENILRSTSASASDTILGSSTCSARAYIRSRWLIRDDTLARAWSISYDYVEHHCYQ